MNKIINFSVNVVLLLRNRVVHDEIKAYIAKYGFTLTEVVKQMNRCRPPDAQTTVQNISNKLSRGTLKYVEALEIASILGLSITWRRKEE